MEKLTDEQMDRLAFMFEIAPRLADAYRIKNEFLSVFLSKSSPKGRKRLEDWLLSVKVMQILEFDDCIRAYRNWFREILNSMDTASRR